MRYEWVWISVGSTSSNRNKVNAPMDMIYPVVNAAGKWGFINGRGELVMDFRFNGCRWDEQIGCIVEGKKRQHRFWGQDGSLKGTLLANEIEQTRLGFAFYRRDDALGLLGPDLQPLFDIPSPSDWIACSNDVSQWVAIKDGSVSVHNLLGETTAEHPWSDCVPLGYDRFFYKQQGGWHLWEKGHSRKLLFDKVDFAGMCFGQDIFSAEYKGRVGLVNGQGECLEGFVWDEVGHVDQGWCAMRKGKRWFLCRLGEGPVLGLPEGLSLEGFSFNAGSDDGRLLVKQGDHLGYMNLEG